MEVILRETIDTLGRAGQVVKVADWLCPQLPAARASWLIPRLPVT